ncbi:MAG: alpha/beta hydrolase [Chloroflexi bacterium]|nr:alpha/beta hydrolase [Chloroflexota bacterium]
MATATSTHSEQTTVVAGKTIRILVGGSGPPAVVLHHSTGNPGWIPFHEALAEHFTVYAVDMPGYGQSERPDWAREPRDIAMLVNRALARLGLDGVTLIGTGFGGFVAAEMVAANDERIAQLVLIGAAGIQPREGEIMDQMLIDYEDYVRDSFRDPATYDATLGASAESLKELWDFSREMTARLSWKPYMFNRRLPHTLSEVHTPTLIIWGGADNVIPLDCAHQYRDALPNATLEVVAGAGHLVEFEEPAMVAKLIATGVTA